VDGPAHRPGHHLLSRPGITNGAELKGKKLIASLTGASFIDARIALRHRTGWVPVGEASIAIAVACPHRTAAYDASRYVIEETKTRVPLWKQEHLASGETRWAGSAHA